MISRETLQKLCRNTGLHLYQQEKDYLIKLFLFYYYRRFEDAIFKGGTALRYLFDTERFSEDIDFNILSFPADYPKEHKLVTTKHYPHGKTEIQAYLKKAGFEKIKFMKNFAGDKFKVNDSKDMFVEAVKPL